MTLASALRGNSRSPNGDFVAERFAEIEVIDRMGKRSSAWKSRTDATMQLPEPTSGTIRFEGDDIATLSPEERRGLRRKIRYIFQGPYASLNPRLTAGFSITEPLVTHGLASGGAARKRVAELLRLVGLQPHHAERYPHEFSGGQRPRICIARALASDPKLVLADESVAARRRIVDPFRRPAVGRHLLIVITHRGESMFNLKKLMAAGALLLSVSTPALAAKDLVIGVPDNLTGLDPHNLNDTLSQSATRLMMQGLFGFDKDMKLIPVLAEGYETNADATEFTIRLRKNVTFHDGTPFNAQAVKISLERLANPENRLVRASLVNMVSQFTVVDDFTVKLTLKEPFGAMINNLAHAGAMIHSPAALEKYGKEVLRHPVGTGPYKFVSWQADTLKVEKNENYWKPGLPKVDSVTVRSVPENGSRLAMLQTGEAQFIYPLPPEMVSVAEKNPKLDIIAKPSIVTWYASMNNMKKPFSDVRVRQALNYAVDKRAFAKVVYNGNAEPMESVFPPGLPFYVKQGEWPYDVAKAKELLKEAGYPDGFETEVFGTNNTTVIRGLQFLQQQLAQVNVKLKVTPLEAGVAAQRIFGVSKPEDATVQLHYIGVSASTGDPDWHLRPTLYSDSFPPKLLNVAYFSNPEVDAAIKAGIATADREKRAEAYAKAQKVAWKEAPWIYLGVERLLAAKSKSLSGVYYLPDRGLLLEEADIN